MQESLEGLRVALGRRVERSVVPEPKIHQSDRASILVDMTTSTAFAGCLADSPGDPGSGDLCLVGLPDDSRSSYRRGAAQGPSAVRSSYDGNCFNSTTESGVDLAGSVIDLGDLRSGAEWSEARQSYREKAGVLFRKRSVPFFIGGDHAVTVPILEALAEVGEPVHVIQLDAHPDLYPEYGGDASSHACVASRALEMPHVASVHQIGIRTMNEVQESEARLHGDRVQIQHARELVSEVPHPATIPATAAVYLTLDIDVLDPAFAPGVSHPVPGGLSTRQILNWIQGIPWRLVGMDVVEVNPQVDPSGRTAVAAGRLLHEGMGVGRGLKSKGES